MSPGWQSRALQMDSKVLNRMAFAFPVFRMDRLERVISTFSESSFNDIFRLAITTSKLTIMGMNQMVSSCSSFNFIPSVKACAISNKKKETVNKVQLKSITESKLIDVDSNELLFNPLKMIHWIA